MKLLSIFIIAVGALSACQNNSATTANANKSVVSPANAQANKLSAPLGNAQTNQPSQPSTVKIGEGTGVVTKINLEIGSVELDHDEIKGMMPAMQMEFYVSDKKELQPLKIGDKVLFTLEDNKGAEKITKITKVE